MVKLVPGQPIATPAPVLAVDPGVPAGRYRLQLVVTDTSGQVSAPFTNLVDIIGTFPFPTPVVPPPVVPPPLPGP